MVLLFFFSDEKCKRVHLSSWHFLSSCVSAAPHIQFSIIPAPCVFCCIKFFHHRYYFCFKFFTTDDPFGMILIHLAWIAERLGGTLAQVSFSSLYHFRLGHDGAHLAQIMWRWVCISPLCFLFVTFLYIHTYHLIAVFHDMSSSSKWCITTFFLLFILHHNMLLMSVIFIFCSFVVISFCSFLQLQLCLLSCAQSHQHQSSSIEFVHH